MTARESGFRVLFVCTGNTCRSPLAAGALLHELGPDAPSVGVASAGTATREGDPASERAVAIARRDGIELGGHRSRRATPELVRGADLVLVMEGPHLAAVRALGADPQRTHLLSEWPVPGEPELVISDPFGGSDEAYEECWRRIRRHIRRVAPHIAEAARARSL